MAKRFQYLVDDPEQVTPLPLMVGIFTMIVGRACFVLTGTAIGSGTSPVHGSRYQAGPVQRYSNCETEPV